jgi:hypothetical protein
MSHSSGAPPRPIPSGTGVMIDMVAGSRVEAMVPSRPSGLGTFGPTGGPDEVRTLWLVRGRDGDDQPSVDRGGTGERADVGVGERATTSAAGVVAGPPDQAALDGMDLRLEPVADVPGW